jgi:hypothetical protein
MAHILGDATRSAPQQLLSMVSETRMSPGELLHAIFLSQLAHSARRRTYDGEIQYATFVGGTRHPDANWYNDEAAGVFANNNGDVYITGCTVDDRLPVTAGALQAERKGNADAFVLRMKFAASQQTIPADKSKNTGR